jgi:hypothetical protein
MDYMRGQDIIGPDSSIELYNYGEPLLHPKLHEIIAWLHRADLGFGLSTNASRVKKFRGPVLENLEYLAISMPGFSQASYDRIHGFDFEMIKTNIIALTSNFRECGFRGSAFIAYHVYQFNQDEMDRACEFALDHGIGFNAYCAFFNDLGMYLDYLDSKMPYEQLKRASQELVLHYVEGLRTSRPADFECPAWGELTLGERCQVLLCCAVDKSGGPGVLGDLFGMSSDAIQKAKAKHVLCKRCMAAGCAYLFYHPRKIPARPHPSADATVYVPEQFANVAFMEKPPSCAGYLESVSPAAYPNSVVVEGWARDPVKDCAAREVLLADETGKVVARGPVNMRRKDVVEAGGFDLARMRNCGWRLRFRRDQIPPGTRHLVGYAFDQDGNVAYRMGNKMPLS